MFIRVELTKEYADDYYRCNGDELYRKVILQIEEIKGVDDAEAFESELETVLQSLGERLYQLEDENDLNCPIRELRERVEAHCSESVIVPKSKSLDGV